MTAPRSVRRPVPHRLRPTVLLVLAAAAGVLGAACGVPVTQPSATPTPTAADPVPAAATVVERLTEDGVSALLRQAVCWFADPAVAADCLPPSDEVLAAIATMGASDDERLIAPLIDLRHLDVGWRRGVDDALEALTGERFEHSLEWYGWLAAQPVTLPEGYLEWKGRLLAFADPMLRDLVGVEARGTLRPELLVWTGTGAGELPALDEPPVVHAALQLYLDGADIVYGLQAGSEARAYPRRIVAWHGVVHDTLDGAEVLVTFCGPCGGASAFAPVAGGQRLRFRDAGLAIDGRRLMTDAQTGSLWDPFTGRAVWGPLAAVEATLPRLSLVSSSWTAWSSDHPNSGVLALDTGFVRDYTEDAWSTLGGTPAVPRFPLVAPIDDALPAEASVVGVVAGGEARAYPADEVRARRIVHDTLSGSSLVLLSQGPGAAIRVYASGPLEVSALTEDGMATGSDGLEGDRWFVQERALVSALDGREVRALSHAQGSWLAWSRAFPDTSVWGQE